MEFGLSVIIPAYNEEQAIRAGKLDLVSDWLARQQYETELLVVDDGSGDETTALARGIVDRVIRIQHKGKAAAIITGIQAAGMNRIMFTDMDQATPVTEVNKLMQAMNKGADVAIGSRGLVRQGAPPGRYVLSLGHTVLHRLLLGLRIEDTQCGFKAFTRTAALSVLDHLVAYDFHAIGTIDFPSVSSGFDTEFLFVAQRMGYRIREVPVIWNYQETRRVDLTRDAFRGVLDLLKMMKARVKHQYPSHKNRNEEKIS
ncbi:MAG TPA: glycosyltransferase [bacterium]|nr:glycosyltransferase [bacterium]